MSMESGYSGLVMHGTTGLFYYLVNLNLGLKFKYIKSEELFSI